MDKLRASGIRIKSAGSVVQNDKRDMSPMGGDRKSARGLAAEGHVPHSLVGSKTRIASMHICDKMGSLIVLLGVALAMMGKKLVIFSTLFW